MEIIVKRLGQYARAEGLILTANKNNSSLVRKAEMIHIPIVEQAEIFNATVRILSTSERRWSDVSWFSTGVGKIRSGNLFDLAIMFPGSGTSYR